MSKIEKSSYIREDITVRTCERVRRSYVSCLGVINNFTSGDILHVFANP